MQDKDDDKNIQDPLQKAVPSDLSDHDERDEGLAVEKHWDRDPQDAMTKAGQRYDQLQEDGVPISAQDWEDEEENVDELSDHLDGAINHSLEQMEEEEYSESEQEEY